LKSAGLLSEFYIAVLGAIILVVQAYAAGQVAIVGSCHMRFWTLQDNIYKKTYQFKTHCKDDMMILLH